MTATGNGNNSDGILSDNSTLTISGGQVTATGNGNNSYGILSSNGTLTISGGQVTANGNGDYSYGITTYYRAITLGWTNYSDFIYANSYHVYESTINIAEGKTFITDDGNTYTSGELTSEELEAIAGKKLYPYVEGSVPYIDENGQRQLCTEYIPLTGNETEPLTTGWYVADNTLNFTNPIMVSGHVHLILKDNAVMNVGTEEYPIDDYQGIGTDEEFASLSIYAQSTGEDKGQLNVYVNKEYASGIRMTEDLTINGGQVTATVVGNLSEGFFTGYVTINGGQVTANGGYSGIISFSVTINGGQVTANGGQNGILSYYDNITLGWTNPTDFIYANSYDFLYPDFYTVIVKEGKTFITDDATPIQVSDTISDLSTINGKTLYPYVAITKSISGHNNSGGWYLIASPVAEVTPAAGNGFLSNEYDLYRFNPSNEGNEWENYKATSFTLTNGQGYLYANSGDVTVVFGGIPYDGNGEVALVFDADDEQKCWNLVGNPFNSNATLDREYYVLSSDGLGINPVAVPATTPVPPFTAVFVKAVTTGDKAVFTKVTP